MQLPKPLKWGGLPAPPCPHSDAFLMRTRGFAAVMGRGAEVAVLAGLAWLIPVASVPRGWFPGLVFEGEQNTVMPLGMYVGGGGHVPGNGPQPANPELLLLNPGL